MTFNPFKQGLHLEVISFLDFDQNRFNQILVLNRLLVPSHPVVATPVDKPYRDTVNRISAIGDYGYISVPRGNINRPKDCSQFSALVRLTTAFEWLRYVSAGISDGS